MLKKSVIPNREADDPARGIPSALRQAQYRLSSGQAASRLLIASVANMLIVRNLILYQIIKKPVAKGNNASEKLKIGRNTFYLNTPLRRSGTSNVSLLRSEKWGYNFGYQP